MCVQLTSVDGGEDENARRQANCNVNSQTFMTVTRSTRPSSTQRTRVVQVAMADAARGGAAEAHSFVLLSERAFSFTPYCTARCSSAITSSGSPIKVALPASTPLVAAGCRRCHVEDDAGRGGDRLHEHEPRHRVVHQEQPAAPAEDQEHEGAPGRVRGGEEGDQDDDLEES